MIIKILAQQPLRSLDLPGRRPENFPGSLWATPAKGWFVTGSTKTFGKIRSLSVFLTYFRNFASNTGSRHTGTPGTSTERRVSSPPNFQSAAAVCSARRAPHSAACRGGGRAPVRGPTLHQPASRSGPRLGLWLLLPAPDAGTAS